MNSVTVQQVMHKKTHSVQCQTPLAAIINTLANTQQSQLPVVNSCNKLLGMVSLIDCQKALLSSAYHCDKPVNVNDIMVKDFISLSTDDTISEVAIKTQSVTENVFPVLRAGMLVGTVQRIDILIQLQNSLALCSVRP